MVSQSGKYIVENFHGKIIDRYVVIVAADGYLEIYRIGILSISHFELLFLYLQLEEFLILHRDAYLRHSAMNYTIEQKNYNNTLTQDLLLLATKNGYMFDTTDFTFVTVRDRIRCYYKSYVQSAKKRGILMGYAAKKAGLLSITPPLHPTSTCNSIDDDDEVDDDDDEEEEMNNSWSEADSATVETH